MDRGTAELKIAEKLLEINEIIKSYNPNPDVICMAITPYFITCFNDPDVDRRIDVRIRRTDVDYDDLGD